MPIVREHATTASIDLNELVETIHTEIDLADRDSLLSLSEKLVMLGNNRSFLSDFFSDYIKNHVYQQSQPVISQAVTLVQTENFYIRANFWLPEQDLSESEAILFAYGQAHDHNYHLLTLAYCGDGYSTDCYLYDYDKVVGYLGEVVDLEPLGSHKHTCGQVLLYECSKDVHIQRAPQQPSITLNVIPFLPKDDLIEQYGFSIASLDSTTGIISSFGYTPIEKRNDLFTMAKYCANPETNQLFIDFAQTHPCRRTRLAALQALRTSAPQAHAALCYQLRDDATPLIQHYLMGKI